MQINKFSIVDYIFGISLKQKCKQSHLKFYFRINIISIQNIQSKYNIIVHLKFIEDFMNWNWIN